MANTSSWHHWSLKTKFLVIQLVQLLVLLGLVVFTIRLQGETARDAQIINLAGSQRMLNQRWGRQMVLGAMAGRGATQATLGKMRQNLQTLTGGELAVEDPEAQNLLEKQQALLDQPFPAFDPAASLREQQRWSRALDERLGRFHTLAEGAVSVLVEETEGHSTRQIKTIALLGALGMAVTLAISLLIQTSVVKPIGRVMVALDRLKEGDLTVRV